MLDQLQYTTPLNPANQNSVVDCKTCEIYLLLNCTAWVESLKHSRRKSVLGRRAYRYCQKRESLSLHGLPSTGRHLLRVLFITSLKSNLCTAVTKSNTTERNCIMAHTKHDCISAQSIFNRTSLSCHNRGTVGFSLGKQLSRSTAYSSVSIITWAL